MRKKIDDDKSIKCYSYEIIFYNKSNNSDIFRQGDNVPQNILDLKGKEVFKFTFISEADKDIFTIYYN